MVKGKAKRRIYFAAGGAVSLIGRLIPKKRNRICFFCKSGVSDNSEALLSHLIREGYARDYQIFCVVGNSHREACRRYEGAGVRMKGLLPGVWELLRSRYIFCHGENLAIMPSRRQISVNYWHGTPLKKINRMLPKLGEYRYDFFTYTTATAPMFRPVFAQAFGCREEQVLLNGHPRCDDLFRKSNVLKRMGYDREAFRQIYLWMPTYRQSRDGLIRDGAARSLENNGIPLFHTREELEKLEAYLEETNCLLFLKLHPAQRIQEGSLRSFRRLIFLTNQELEARGILLYQLVREADVLLTDYSSVYFDYLLLDRPIGFVLEDLDTYGAMRGFVVEDPLSYMPGEKLRNQEEFFRFLRDSLAGKDGWRAERSRVNALVNASMTSHNCEDLLRQIGLSR